MSNNMSACLYPQNAQILYIEKMYIEKINSGNATSGFRK